MLRRHILVAFVAHFRRGDQGVLIVRAVLAALLLLFCVSASSQEPGNRQAVTKEDKKTGQPKPATNVDTSSLEKAIRESIKEASEKPDANADQKLEIDRKLAEYTEHLAIYTEELSKYTGDVATFTFWLVIATVVLGAIGVGQGYLAWRSVKTAESALTDLERPYIFLDLHEQILRDIIATAGAKRTVNLVRTSTPVRYGLINRGRTPALLKDFCQRLVSGGMPDPIDPNDPEIEGVVSLKGQDVGSDPYQCTVHFLGVEGNIDSLFLIGFIRYQDIFQRKHITGFCAKYSFSDNRFALIGGDRYNYTRDE